ncbi:MAG: NHL repeat-containing protein, partial [Candidatus Korobacteraceae bacterium]
DDPTIFNIPAVVKVNTQGIQSTVSTSGINSPNGIAVDSDGSVYIADSQHNRIVKLTSQGAQSVVVQLGQEPFSTPYSVAVDGQRNVYAVIGNRAIIKVTPSGQQSTVVSIGSEPKPNAFLSDAIAVDSVGNVYAFYNQASLVRYNPQGQQMTLSSVTSEFSYGLAVDFQGNVFFGTQSAVQRRSTSGSVTTVVGGLNGPGGIVVDGNANVYIADTENKRILKMRPF